MLVDIGTLIYPLRYFKKWGRENITALHIEA
jgi:hypothetical protein